MKLASAPLLATITLFWGLLVVESSPEMTHLLYVRNGVIVVSSGVCHVFSNMGLISRYWSFVRISSSEYMPQMHSTVQESVRARDTEERAGCVCVCFAGEDEMFERVERR